MKRIIIIQLIILLAIICLPSVLQAQPGFTDDTNDVPIDGGLSLLVAAGVGYGVRKMKKTRDKSAF